MRNTARRVHAVARGDGRLAGRHRSAAKRVIAQRWDSRIDSLGALCQLGRIFLLVKMVKMMDHPQCVWSAAKSACGRLSPSAQAVDAAFRAVVWGPKSQTRNNLRRTFLPRQRSVLGLATPVVSDLTDDAAPVARGKYAVG